MSDVKKVTTPEFRVSFPNVFEPVSFNGGEAKYSICMLFDKSTDISALKKEALKAVQEEWGADKTKWPKNLRLPWRDGDQEKPDIDGYQNTIFINATSKQKPGIVDRALNPILNREDFYAGCYARATLKPFTYDNTGNRGVSFGLQNLQFLRDGESFSGRAKAENDFEAAESFDDKVSTKDDMFE